MRRSVQRSHRRDHRYSRRIEQRRNRNRSKCRRQMPTLGHMSEQLPTGGAGDEQHDQDRSDPQRQIGRDR
jgi:hypothetical protein